MDTTDPNIGFDAQGVCSHCRRYQKKSLTALIPADHREKALQDLVCRIKKQGQGKRYDCGSKIGYLEATMAFALRHPDVGTEFAELLQRMK